MSIGIYILRFKGTDKVYIGQSVNIYRRYTDHLYSLRIGEANYKMLGAYKKYGEPSLEILVECSTEELDTLEEEAISIFNSVDNGYNILYSSTDRHTGYGELSTNSVYSNTQVIDTFKLLVRNTERTYQSISNITNVQVDTVAKIACLDGHTWLEEEFPEEYKVLRELKYLRNNSGESHYHAKHTNVEIEDVFFLLIKDPPIPFKQISFNTGVSEIIVASIAKLENHKWLQAKFPAEYDKLIELKGSRKGNPNRPSGIKYPKLQSPNGEIFEVLNASGFSRQHNLDSSCLIKVLKGKRTQHKGWKLA